MPYMTYNLPMQRTGFRPYYMTNTWSATQLSGVPLPARPRQVFSEPGGRRLIAGMGQGHAFSPWLLHGMGQMEQCSGPSGDFISCSDPSCSYGPCGPATPQPPLGLQETACGDATGAFVMCGDPGCKTGPCVGVTCPPGQSNRAGFCVPTTGVQLGPGPSPRVFVPTTLFPQTAPPTATSPGIPGCDPGIHPGGCQPAAASQWTQYLPYLLLGGLAIALLGSRR